MKTSLELYIDITSNSGKYKLPGNLRKMQVYLNHSRLHATPLETALRYSKVFNFFVDYSLEKKRKPSVFRFPLGLTETPAMRRVYDMLALRGALKVESLEAYDWKGSVSIFEPVTLESSQAGDLSLLFHLLGALYSEAYFGPVLMKEAYRNGRSLHDMVMAEPLADTAEAVRTFCEQQSRNRKQGETYDDSIRYYLFFHDTVTVFLQMKRRNW